MSWVNLDDVYVNKSGDSIAGNLSVGGVLTINDGKGTDTTYNVANEITTLRDSVSHDTKYAHLSWRAPYTDSKIQFDRIGNIVICHGNVKFTTSIQCNYAMANETLPKGFRPTEANVPVVFSINGRFALFFETNGEVKMLGNPNSDYACCTGSWYTKDDFPE